MSQTIIDARLSQIILEPLDQNKIPLLSELIRSIHENGIINPVILLDSDPEFYTIVSGKSRCLAATALGLMTIPAIIVKTSDAC